MPSKGKKMEWIGSWYVDLIADELFMGIHHTVVVVVVVGRFDRCFLVKDGTSSTLFQAIDVIHFKKY
jgi:hypothetical protein